MSEQNQNEVIVSDQVALKVVEENDNYVIMQNEEGKYVRKAKYEEISTFTSETKEDKIWLFNLMDGDEDSGNGLKDHMGKQIEVEHVITRKYDKINEDTGQQEFGVLTYLITPDRVAYITSSKSVYFSIMKLVKLFGVGEEGKDNLVIKVGKKRGTSGHDAVTIKLVG